jgi:hypothetical protein
MNASTTFVTTSHHTYYSQHCATKAHGSMYLHPPAPQVSDHSGEIAGFLTRKAASSGGSSEHDRRTGGGDKHDMGESANERN